MAWYVRLVAATCRPDGPLPSRDQVVLAFFHEYNLVAAVAGLRFRDATRHVSFSTRPFRGVVMTSLLAGLGAGSVPLPAPDDRAGAARLTRAMARVGAEGRSPVVSPDGPFGPYRRPKPGALIVARESGLPILPWAVAVRPALRLGWRWDRQLVPLPFCRLRVVEGARIAVGPRDRLRPRLVELEAELVAAARAADAWQ